MDFQFIWGQAYWLDQNMIPKKHILIIKKTEML